jgi:hypothetical protein
MTTIYRSTWGDVLPTCGEFVWGESKIPPEEFGGVRIFH